MKQQALIAAALVVLTACGLPTARDLYGKGPVPNKAFVEAGFQKYLQQAAPGYFFVAEDGSTYGYSYCSISGSGCVGPEMRIAQDACLRNSRGKKCWIYGRDQRIVWDESVPKPMAADLAASAQQPAAAPSRPETSANQAPALTTAKTNIEPKPSSTATAKGEPARTNRPIAVRWEGYTSLLAGTAVILPNGDTGEMSMVLPNNDGICIGSYKGTSQGTWSVACTNGLAASGTFQMRGQSIGSTGTGKDTRGRTVDFTIAGEPRN